MPVVHFTPTGRSGDYAEGTKLLVAARKLKVPIRFGCAACQCGTCGVKVAEGAASLSQMKPAEEALLEKMGLQTDGSVRLSCQARLGAKDARIDIDFQKSYSP